MTKIPFSMLCTVPAIANVVTKQSAKVRCMNKVVVLFFLILLSIRVLMARMFPTVDRITKPWGGKQQINKIYISCQL
jgi:hypothetical protein